MEIRRRIPACVLPALIACAAQAVAVTDANGQEPAVDVPREASSTQEIEPAALAVVKGLAEVLDAASQFDYEIDTAFDVVQRSGTKVEFGATRKVQVARPDRMRMEIQRREGNASVVILDGDNLWAYAPEQNVYAKTGQHGDLYEATEYAAAELDIESPLNSLTAADFYAQVLANLRRALLLEEQTVDGSRCEHVLMSNDYADFQLWVTKADQPVLKRVVITYRQARGEPQFQARFLKWDFAPPREPGQFTFIPPEDATQIRFFASNLPTDLDQESEQ